LGRRKDYRESAYGVQIKKFVKGLSELKFTMKYIWDHGWKEDYKIQILDFTHNPGI
jgi:hypothetical protein